MKYKYRSQGDNRDQLVGSLIVIYKPDIQTDESSSCESSSMVGINAYETPLDEHEPKTSRWLHPAFCRHRMQQKSVTEKRETGRQPIVAGDRVEIVEGNDTGCYGRVVLVSHHMIRVVLEGTKGTEQRYYDFDSLKVVKEFNSASMHNDTLSSIEVKDRIHQLLEELSEVNPPPVRSIAFEASSNGHLEPAAKGINKPTKYKRYHVKGGSQTTKTEGTTKCASSSRSSCRFSSPSDEEASIRERYTSILPGNDKAPPVVATDTTMETLKDEPFIIDLVDSSEHLLSPAHSVASAPRHSIFRGVSSPKRQHFLRMPNLKKKPLRVGDTVDIIKGIYKEKTGKVVKITGNSVAHVQVKGTGVPQLLSQSILSPRPDPPIGLNALFACAGGPPSNFEI